MSGGRLAQGIDCVVNYTWDIHCMYSTSMLYVHNKVIIVLL